MTDLPALYRAHAQALCALVADLGDDDLRRPVPATPAWTPRDVLAHQAGVAADLLAGRMDGAPGPTWTAHQVAERRALPVADVVAEWHSHLDAVADLVSGSEATGRPPAMLWDVACHHADLHEALGRGRLPEATWAPVLEGRLARSPEGRAALAGGHDRYELFRAVFSRRSHTQVADAAPWLSAEQVDGIGAFGPRDDDQPIPGPA